MVLVIPFNQAMAVRQAADVTRIISPRLLSNGEYAVSENVLNDPAHSAHLDYLSQGYIRTVDNTEYSPLSNELFVMGRPYQLYVARKSYALSRTGDNVLRMELRYNDVGWSGDPLTLRHRCEITASESKLLYGTEYWYSFSFMVEDGAPFGTGNGFVCSQFHGTDPNNLRRSPPLEFHLDDGSYRIYTRSSALLNPDGSGSGQLRYDGPPPPRGTWVNWVVRVVFGQVGLLQAWRDSLQVVDLSNIPIGYYSGSDGPTHKFGIYGQNMATPVAVRYANVELGTSSLAARITSPLAVVEY